MDKRQLPWYKRLKRERVRHNWSQRDVARHIGSDPKTISRWEQGHAFPSAYHRQKLVELFQKDAEELGLMEETAQDRHEDYNEQLLASSHPSQTTSPVAHPIVPASTDRITDISQREHALSLFEPSDGSFAVSERADLLSWHEDWGEASSIDSFYGRIQECADVTQWIIDEHCRMVVVLGIGGVGKTTFATKVARQVSHDFEYVFWRSLQNAPAIEHILESCLQSFSEQQHVAENKDLDGQISFLLNFLREHRCLLLLDNVESVLQAGQRAGQYTETFQGYGRFFQRIGASQHFPTGYQGGRVAARRPSPRSQSRARFDASRP